MHKCNPQPGLRSFRLRSALIGGLSFGAETVSSQSIPGLDTRVESFCLRALALTSPSASQVVAWPISPNPPIFVCKAIIGAKYHNCQSRPRGEPVLRMHKKSML